MSIHPATETPGVSGNLWTRTLGRLLGALPGRASPAEPTEAPPAEDDEKAAEPGAASTMVEAARTGRVARRIARPFAPHLLPELLTGPRPGRRLPRLAGAH